MQRVGKKNNLGDIELEVVKDFARKRRNHRYSEGGQTRAAVKRRKPPPIKGRRLPVPVPKNKALSEIHEMDAQDQQFRHPQGRPREWGVKKEPENWREVIRKEGQRKANERRARVRKWEAEVHVAQKVMKTHADKDSKEIDIYDDEKLIADHILSLEEWDNEELIRGYRRNRNGKFGAPPKFIPREVQQEAFRRLVNRGERKMKEAYMVAIERLIELAHDGSSEKVKLEAIKELMNRVVGKIPDRVLVGTEQPWEGVLADSLVPMSEATPIELYPQDDGTYALDPGVVDLVPADASEGEVDAPSVSVAAAEASVPKDKAPSPSPPRRKKKKVH